MFIEWYGQICQMFVPKEIMEYLKILPKLKTKNINYIEYRILKYICEYPNSTSYDIEAKLGLPRRQALLKISGNGALHRKKEQ